MQVREDNAAIAALDSNANNLKQQIRMVQELIEQAEQVKLFLLVILFKKATKYIAFFEIKLQ